VADFGLPAAAGKLRLDCELQFGLGQSCSPRGVVVLRTIFRATADALSDVLKNAGYATVWQPPYRRRPIVRGAVAGIWDGVQLCDDEAVDLAKFCSQLGADAAPVLAFLDFPRRDRVDQALAIGAAAVIAKPWLNSELIATIDELIANAFSSRGAA
jgi:hypothetical protein